MTCDDCRRLFMVENRVIHLPDTDAVVSITMTTAEPIGHHQFIGGVEQFVREEMARYE